MQSFYLSLLEFRLPAQCKLVGILNDICREPPPKNKTFTFFPRISSHSNLNCRILPSPISMKILSYLVGNSELIQENSFQNPTYSIPISLFAGIDPILRITFMKHQCSSGIKKQSKQLRDNLENEYSLNLLHHNKDHSPLYDSLYSQAKTIATKSINLSAYFSCFCTLAGLILPMILLFSMIEFGYLFRQPVDPVGSGIELTPI